MASADTAQLHSSNRMHDEDHDHVGSGASTPPNGTATPRPDLHDKRLPGIVNTYFAQVCDSLRLRSSSTANSAAANPAPEMIAPEKDEKEPSAPAPAPSHPAQDDPAQQAQAHPDAHNSPAVAALSQALAGGGAPANTMLPTAPNSPPSGAASAQQVESPPLLPSEKRQKQQHTPDPTHTTTSASSTATPQAAIYPTPPLSSSSSLQAMNDVEASSGGASAATASSSSTLSRKRSWAERKKSQSQAHVPSQLRRNTLPSALSNIVITKPAVAAHLSNPSAEPSAPACPSVVARSSSPPRSQEKENQLTQASEPQNTPPHTPRSGSHASRSREDDIQSTAKSSRSGSGGSQAATVGQVRGQLEICVEEGRGLRPAVDPYVVAIFQLNEDISGGPKEDEMDTQPDSSPPQDENLAKGVAMKRMGSGQGTPMAIPGLRSRQTSSTNIADMRRGQKGHQETTDPVWRHKATFDVVGSNNELDISVWAPRNGARSMATLSEEGEDFGIGSLGRAYGLDEIEIPLYE